MLNWLRDPTRKVYEFLTGLSLSAEHWAMGAVIAVSTWHVLQHMNEVEGSLVVASLMGIVLGGLNALFAFRLFERKGENLWPAATGLVLSVVVSTYMQYAFYDANSSLTRYDWGFINLSAFLSGVWAPLFEVVLGWLYGVRIASLDSRNSLVDRVVNEWSIKVSGLEKKFSAELVTAQDLRDQLHRLKNDWSVERLQLDLKLQEYLKKIDQLTAQLSDLRTDRAVLVERSKHGQPAKIDHRPVVVESSGRLSTTARRQRIAQMDSSGELAGYDVSSLAKQIGAQRSTIRTDLKHLNIKLKTQEITDE